VRFKLRLQQLELGLAGQALRRLGLQLLLAKALAGEEDITHHQCTQDAEQQHRPVHHHALRLDAQQRLGGTVAQRVTDQRAGDHDQRHPVPARPITLCAVASVAPARHHLAAAIDQQPAGIADQQREHQRRGVTAVDAEQPQHQRNQRAGGLVEHAADGHRAQR
jgi:hypothetical protein